MKTILNRGSLLSIALVLLAALIPLFTTSSYYQGLFILTFIWIVVNQGLNIILGFTGYTSLVQGGLFGVGAYITAICATTFGMNVWSAALIAIAGNGLIALTLALIVFRTSGHFFAILTLSMSLILDELFHNLAITGGNLGISGVPGLFPSSWPRETYYYFVLAVMLLAIAFVAWLRKSRLGYGLRGIGSNDRLAASVGVPLYVYKTASFVLSALFAGVGGVLYVYFTGFVSPAPFNVAASMACLLAVVIGGSGTLLGPVLGSILLVFLPAWLQNFQDYQLTIYGLAVILIIRFMPKGLVGLGRYFKRNKAVPKPAKTGGEEISLQR
ncbi:branched-chain amino acid ABC transporter permease [Paenibacillus sp. EPM92]|uniref:branched-chain amino acid ABC transporter permease n=1 Tax=Paenibacillus sp. EPM92 TaxID=1561195 RepID=UPI0006D1E45F|nr:branched-chain amino acid ABC transporter permease [Paenibacillus sp. EPM92]